MGLSLPCTVLAVSMFITLIPATGEYSDHSAPLTPYLVSDKCQLGLRNPPRQYLLSLMLPGIRGRAASVQEEGQQPIRACNSGYLGPPANSLAMLPPTAHLSGAAMARRGRCLLQEGARRLPAGTPGRCRTRAFSAQTLRGNTQQLAGPTSIAAPPADVPGWHTRLPQCLQLTALRGASGAEAKQPPLTQLAAGRSFSLLGNKPRGYGGNQAGGFGVAARPYKHHKSCDFNPADHS